MDGENEEGEDENATSEGVNLIVNNGQNEEGQTEEQMEGDDGEEGSPDDDGDNDPYTLTPE